MPLPANRKRQIVWEQVQGKMKEKRTMPDAMKRAKGQGSSAPHKVIVQKLSSEADTRQTYRPIQPREFVEFPFEDLTLANLKSACAAHFNFPIASCDILVTNKGPSCNNISQIPHRKDKVYLVCFMHVPDDASSLSAPSVSQSGDEELLVSQFTRNRSSVKNHSLQKPRKMPLHTEFPASISIGELLRAGKLVAPVGKRKIWLSLESFNIANQEWKEERKLEFTVFTEKFSEGGFRNAFKCSQFGEKAEPKSWVLKLYKEHVKETIGDQLGTTTEIHARKQVQMHEVARYIAKKLKAKAAPSYGDTFEYNKVFFTTYDGEPATIEEFIPGQFIKYVNNNGACGTLLPHLAAEKELYYKAEALVHFSHEETQGKMMLLDIQGIGLSLCDPEIATSTLTMESDCESNKEVLFCCGNLSVIAINRFLKQHHCNEFCIMLGLKENTQSESE